MKLSTFPTVDEIKNKSRPILPKYGVKQAAVFGSVASGRTHGRSDIDILVEFRQPIGLFDFVGLKLELEDALGHKVDLVQYSVIKPLLRDSILSSEVAHSVKREIGV